MGRRSKPRDTGRKHRCTKDGFFLDEEAATKRLHEIWDNPGPNWQKQPERVYPCDLHGRKTVYHLTSHWGHKR